MRNLIDLQELQRFENVRVLEVAAGDPRLACYMVTRGCDVVANDLRAHSMLDAVAGYGCEGKVTVIPADLFALDPEKLGQFDLIIAREVIEHVAHPDQMLAHLRRFLPLGGRLFVTTPNGRYWRSRLPTFRDVRNVTHELESRQFQPDADGHLFALTPAEIVELANDAGFTIDRVSVWGTPALTGHVALSTFSSRAVLPLTGLAEALAQRLPPAARERICSAMAAMLVAA